MDVVGFDVTEKEREQLECIAKAGGGSYFTAQNTLELKKALVDVRENVVERSKPVTFDQKPGLQLKAVLDEGTEPINKNIYWIVYNSQPELNGKRCKVAHSNSPDPMFSLPEGSYYIIAKHGDAQAAMEVDVAAGERKDAVMNMKTGYLKLEAILNGGEKPIKKNIYWGVYTSQPELNGKRRKVAHSNSPDPMFSLPEGSYYIIAKHGDAQAAMEVDVVAGERKDAVMNMKAGYVKSETILNGGEKPIKKNTHWRVYTSQTELNVKRREIAHSNKATPLFCLLQGSDYITAKHGKTLLQQSSM
jgi:hypothetical protein